MWTSTRLTTRTSEALHYPTYCVNRIGMHLDQLATKGLLFRGLGKRDTGLAT